MLCQGVLDKSHDEFGSNELRGGSIRDVRGKISLSSIQKTYWVQQQAAEDEEMGDDLGMVEDTTSSDDE